MSGAYRSIGINRNDFLSVIQMRPDLEKDAQAVEWVAFASNAFNVLVPFYADVLTTPEYLSNTTGEVSTDNFYWGSRMIAAMADASYKKSIFHIERYKEKVMSRGHEIIGHYDALLHRRGMSISAWSKDGSQRGGRSDGEEGDTCDTRQGTLRAKQPDEEFVFEVDA